MKMAPKPTDRVETEDEEGDSRPFIMPPDIIGRSVIETKRGVKITVTPHELMQQMRAADVALNGDSNDAEHDALYELRGWLSDVYEDIERRTKGD